MLKYRIWYKEIVIGILEIDGEKYNYMPSEEGIEKAKNEVTIPHELTEKSGWREPIPFFKNRLEDAKRFNKVEVITTHRDYFKMELLPKEA